MDQDEKRCGICGHYKHNSKSPGTGHCLKSGIHNSTVLSINNFRCKYWESEIEYHILNRSW